MKQFLMMVLFLASVSFSSGQTVSPSPENQRIRDFGSSLKKYEQQSRKKKKRDLPTPPTQQNISPNNDGETDGTISVQTDLVASSILVTDAKSNVIPNLKKEDFIVTEDGIPQMIEVFSSAENERVPRSIVLLLDYANQQGPYIETSIRAAKVLIDKLNPQDRMAIVTNDIKIQIDFTFDKDALKNTLDSLKKIDYYRGSGRGFGTLIAVLNEMFVKEDRQPIIIYQSGGMDAIWLRPDQNHPYPVSYSTLYNSGGKWGGVEKGLLKYGFREVKEAIERSPATIYSVIPGIRFLGLSKKEREERAKITLTETSRIFGFDTSYLLRTQLPAEAERIPSGQAAMFRVAELSGGNAGFIEKPEDAENIYADIFTVIKNRYVIGYYPTNETRDGQKRLVKITVRDHPEYTVTGRDGYFAAGSENRHSN